MAARNITKYWAAAAVTAAAAPLIGAQPTAAAEPVVPTAGTTAAAALIVGGTTFPTLDQSFMQQLWPAWNASLGLANPEPPNLINVAYPAELYPFTSGDYLGTSVAAGVDALLGLLATTYTAGEHLIVWGISQGAMVLDATQRLLSNTTAAPPAGSLTFVRVADPAAAVTGLLNFLPNLIMSDVLHLDSWLRTAADDSQYDTIVVSNEYDGFADFPDRPWNFLAVANALIGLVYRHGQTATADLVDVPAQNISTAVNAQGATITTYLVPSRFLPLTQPLRDAGVSAGVVDKLDNILRPIIDAGYSRNTGGALPADTTTPTAPPAAENQPVSVADTESAPTPVVARSRQSTRARHTERPQTTALVSADYSGDKTAAGRHPRRGR
jgi:hypothetical protein